VRAFATTNKADSFSFYMSSCSNKSYNRTNRSYAMNSVFLMNSVSVNLHRIAMLPMSVVAPRPSST
jgi:hypothetical protein